MHPCCRLMLLLVACGPISYVEEADIRSSQYEGDASCETCTAYNRRTDASDSNIVRAATTVRNRINDCFDAGRAHHWAEALAKAESALSIDPHSRPAALCAVAASCRLKRSDKALEYAASLETAYLSMARAVCA